ncbi:MAG: NusG domain II-containing protein [Clostridia bacterium]|nr:NusG domain II-containing protein [Clostridia bacterium]
MPKRKDILIIAVVVVVAALMLGVSKLMPKTDLSNKTADVTLAPDVIEYLDATPEVTAEPTQALTEAPTAAPEATEAPTAAPEATAEPTEAPTAAPEATAEPTEAPTAEPEKAEVAGPVMAGPMPPKQAAEVRGHVLLTIGNRQYGDPIPMDRDKIITLKQEDGKINKVHITPEKVYMESSTCDNQDCVQQGEIHVDTYQDRILGTYVICLPNNVTIEMVPAE